MHLRKFNLADLPIGTVDTTLSPEQNDENLTDDERKVFNDWLQARWAVSRVARRVKCKALRLLTTVASLWRLQEKDELMDAYYKNGEFPCKEGQQITFPLKLRSFDDWVSRPADPLRLTPPSHH